MTNRRTVRLLILVLLTGTLAFAVDAQNPKHDSQLKTVRGVVVDKSENPVSASVVFLKNVRTNQVKSYIADNQGNYRFSGLDPNVDYEIHAESKEETSAKRTISSFDNRKEIVIVLKVDKKRSEK